MGTRNGKHYLLLYPFLGLREIYGIAEDACLIAELFELKPALFKVA